MTRLTQQRPARLAEVAEAAGVSKATASNVFNRPQVVREEVRARVLAAAEAIGYRGPDPKGRLLSAGRVNAIGVATVEPLAYFFEDPYSRFVLAAIARECDARGSGISLISAAAEEQLAWNLRSAVVDGFLLFCLAGAERLIALSRERNLPFVALGATAPGDAATSAIGVDDFAGARAVARHLAGLGHRRFAVLALEFSPGGQGRTTPERVEAAAYPDSADRLRGYFEAFREAGVDPAAVPVFETLNDAPTVAAALEAIFAEPEPPTAILAQSDRIALHALDWLKGRGLSVPGDVSLAGFDGVPESAISDPPLTTVSQPIAEIGRRAVAAILDRPGELTREVLPTELVIRGSTAPPRP